MTRWPACTSRHSYKPLFSIDQANGQHVGPVQHFRNSGKGYFHNCHFADPPSPAPPISDPPPPPNAQFGFNSASICRPGPTISPRGSIKPTNPHGCFLFFFLSAKHSSFRPVPISARLHSRPKTLLAPWASQARLACQSPLQFHELQPQPGTSSIHCLDSHIVAPCRQLACLSPRGASIFA